jgi:hypothetical protein
MPHDPHDHIQHIMNFQHHNPRIINNEKVNRKTLLEHKLYKKTPRYINPVILHQSTQFHPHTWHLYHTLYNTYSYNNKRTLKSVNKLIETQLSIPLKKKNPKV